MMKKTAKIFLAFSLFTFLCAPRTHGAAFQFGGIRFDDVVVTSGGTTTQLTSADKQVRTVTGSSLDTEVLPNATTLQGGYWFKFINQSTLSVTVESYGGSSLETITSGSAATFHLTANGTTAGTWSIESASSGGGSAAARSVLQKSGTYTIQASDFDQAGYRLLVEMSCTTLCDAYLPAASNKGYDVYVVNTGSSEVDVASVGTDRLTVGSTQTTLQLMPFGIPQMGQGFIGNGVSAWDIY